MTLKAEPILHVRGQDQVSPEGRCGAHRTAGPSRGARRYSSGDREAFWSFPRQCDLAYFDHGRQVRQHPPPQPRQPLQPHNSHSQEAPKSFGIMGGHLARRGRTAWKGAGRAARAGWCGPAGAVGSEMLDAWQGPTDPSLT